MAAAGSTLPGSTLPANATLPTWLHMDGTPSTRLAAERGLRAAEDRWKQSHHRTFLLSTQSILLALLVMLILAVILGRRWRRLARESPSSRCSVWCRKLLLHLVPWRLLHRQRTRASAAEDLKESSVVEMGELGGMGGMPFRRGAGVAVTCEEDGRVVGNSSKSQSASPSGALSGVAVHSDGTVQVLSAPALLASTSQPPSVLSTSQQLLLRKQLPPRHRLCDWELLYSTEQHGCSLRTFHSRLAGHAGTLLVVLDSAGHIFGAYVSEEWEQRARYFGNGETFLFRVQPSFARYDWARQNDHFVLPAADCIAFGGGGHFALYLDESLEFGSSQPSATFDNECLAGSVQFKVVKVEVWGFGA